MSTLLPKPSLDELRRAIVRARPELADMPIAPLSEGWEFWTYTAGDYILRVPKSDKSNDGGDREWPVLESLQVGQRLLEALEALSTLPLPHPTLVEEALADGRPLSLHRRIPGVSVVDLRRPLAPGFGVALGRFLRRLHEFPVERARALRLEYDDGPAARRIIINTYETFVRRAFPVLGCESRTHATRTFEAHINDPAAWSFLPRFHHADINEHNVLADPDTGELTGVIDFGDARVGDAAGDATWAYIGGFERHGIAGQIPAFLNELGITVEEMERHRVFLEVWWPLDDIDHAIETDDRDVLEEAIPRLYAVTPRGIVCNT